MTENTEPIQISVPELESKIDTTDVNAAEEAILDESEVDQTVRPIQYQISSYGADIDAEGFVNRLRRNDVYIPPFQRDYVWNQREASRFIESLLLGLPVPGVFLARERDSKRLLVIDGQQRLKTLEFFLDGYFDPKADKKLKRIFDLQGVQAKFAGLTYETLDPEDKIALNDSIIHATIVKQEDPDQDNSCIYHIFERLNTSGRKLSPQQIRVAIYHGFIIDMLHELNNYAPWRSIYGGRSRTLKDEEMILRFLAFYYDHDSYSRPMADFLNSYLSKMMSQGEMFVGSWIELFEQTISYIWDACGKKAFKPERSLNAAVFDSIMVGTARRLENKPWPSTDEYKEAYEKLIKHETFALVTSRSTADESSVKNRLELATEAFANL